MKKDKFDKMLAEAVNRTQPAMPKDMTERFMERMRKEKIVPPPVRRRFSLWYIPAIAAAAAVLLLMLIPIRTEEQVVESQPLLATSGMPMPLKTGGEMVGAKKTVAEAFPSARVETAEKAGRAKPKAMSLLAQATPKHEQQESLLEIAEADTAGCAAPVETLAEDEKKPTTPFFTAHELELMALAEAKRAHVEMYLAEMLQCALLEQREWEYQPQKETEEEIVVKNV